MRFVSCYANLGLGTARKERWVLAVDGQRDLATESLPVQFTREYLNQDDIDFALSYFPAARFTGKLMEADGYTPEPLALRIGVFDTEEEQVRKGWSDEEREIVEKFMTTKPNYGQDFVEVKAAEKTIEKPWSTYDGTHHFKIPTIAAEIGCVPEALAYEQANKNRPGVVSGLEEQLEIITKAGGTKKAAEEAGEVVAA